MQYAIIEISGKQVWVESGKFYDINRIPIKLGKEISLNRVLLARDITGSLSIGQPYLNNVKITGKILEHFKGEKKIIYKMKSKKKTKSKNGHRQELTRVLIQDINIVNK